MMETNKLRVMVLNEDTKEIIYDKVGDQILVNVSNPNPKIPGIMVSSPLIHGEYELLARNYLYMGAYIHAQVFKKIYEAKNAERVQVITHNAIVLLQEQGYDKEKIIKELGITPREYDEATTPETE